MKRQKEKGSVLIAVIIVLVLSSMAALALSLTLQDYARMEVKDRQEIQSQYVAEAGPLEVVSWFNTQGAAIASAAPSLAPLFQVNTTTGKYSNLATALTAGTLDITHQAPSLLPVVRDSHGKEVGRVTDLKILPPVQPNPPITDLLCIIHSEGVTQRTKNTKVADLYIAYHVLKIEGSPGVILVEAAAAFGGNVKAHWGEVWTRANLKMPNQSQTPTQAQDQWLKFRTEQKVEFPSNWGATKWGKPTAAGTYGTIVSPALTTPNNPCEGTPVEPDYGQEIQQDQTLSWPVYDYQTLKNMAKSKGRYYQWGTDGYLYGDGIKDVAHRVTDYLALNTPGDRANWPNVKYDVVFVDTVTGTAPTPGQVHPTIALNGSGFSWKGFYFLCANLDVSGMGQPSAISVKRPDGVMESKNAFMDGILMVFGTYSGTGNELIYGTVHADQGFVGTGTPDVYYNVDLRNGFPAPINSDVHYARWKITK